jgi:malonyl-CoA O-methyltransferase
VPIKPTPLDRRAARRAFDRAAGSYDEHAVLQHEVRQRLLERLEYQQHDPARILDVGCGTGQGSHFLRQRYPQAEVIALDWAPGMLHDAVKVSGQKRPHVLCADMQALPLASRSMDIVFSNLAAQWSPDPERLFAEFRRILRPGGLLMFSTFGVDTLQELRAAWAEADDGPHVNEFTDIQDLGDLLMALGFAEPVLDMEMFTLDYPDVMALMRDLKAIGAHNAVAGRRRQITGKARLRRMLDAYERFRVGGRYPASWEVIYGAAFGPEEGQPYRSGQGEIAEFSLDALRTSRVRRER